MISALSVGPLAPDTRLITTTSTKIESPTARE
jgi:hypothetical protein